MCTHTTLVHRGLVTVFREGVSGLNRSTQLSRGFSTRAPADRWWDVDHPRPDISNEQFAARLGPYLKSARRARGMRLRQLADSELGVGELRAVEKGKYPLTPLVVSALAARYGADLAGVMPPRDPVVLLATGTISTGGLEETFDPHELGSVLDAYVRLVRKLRDSRGLEMVTLRREDLIDIADQLDRPRTDVVDRVAALMGANDSQRRAMVELFLSGAEVVGVAA